MKIKFVDKHCIEPKFGRTVKALGIALVREDLPGPVKKFVATHELYHLEKDHKAKWWVWREIRANAYALVRHPLGGVLCFFMTLFDWERWSFYICKFKERR